MDAMELTIPEASKLPQSDANEEIKDAGSGGSGDFFFGSVNGLKVDGSFCKDTERQRASSQHNSSSSAKMCDHLLDSMPSSSEVERNGRKQSTAEVGNSTLSSRNDECQQKQKKFTKSLCDNSWSKCPRTNQPDIPTNPFLTKCSSSDKLRGIKQKYVQEGKRCERKHLRSAGKSKFDVFVSKTGLTSSDTGCTKNILGIYGLKADISDVTEDVSDLPLAGLLDGSYRCPSPSRGKEKKFPAFNDIMHSVRKSYLHLQYNSCTVKEEGNNDPACQPNCNSSPTCATDCDNEDEFTEEILPSCKDSIRETLWNSQLYPPNVTMKLLELPTMPDLDSLIQESNMNSSSPLHGTRLPPFSWSRSHNGPSKPCVDTGKLMANKTNCQSKWVQTGGNPNVFVNYRNFSAESDQKVHVHAEDGSKQQKINDLLEEVKDLMMNHSLPCYETVKEPLVVINALESCNNLDEDMGLIDKKAADGSVLYDGNFEHPPDLSSCNFRLCENTVINEENNVGVSHVCTSNCSYFYLKDSDGLKHSSQQSSTWRCFIPEIFNAAKILFEMSKKTRLSKKSDLRGKNTAQQVRDSKIYLKSSKSGPSAGQIYSKHGPAINVKRKKLSCENVVGREQGRWLTASPEGSIPVKLNSSFALSRKPHSIGPFKEMDSHPMRTRMDKVNNRHHVSKEGSVETTSYADAGKCGRKEFSGGKRKRT